MNSKIAISIGVGISIAIVVIFLTFQETEISQVEETFDGQIIVEGETFYEIIIPDEETFDEEIILDQEILSEIQKRLDDVEQINLENKYSPKQREWLTSGPFQIDRSEYILGEKIFLVIGGIDPKEKGQIAFLRPLNDTHNSVFQTIPFDGTEKRAFNYYLQPQLSKINGYCTVDDFVGEWRVVFRGTDYPNLEFRITDEILPGDEESFSPVC